MKVLATLWLLVAVMVASQAVGAVEAEAYRLTVHDLTVEYKSDPLGIDTPRPRLGWKLDANRRAVSQAAYQVQVYAGTDRLDTGEDLVWDSGKVESDASVHQEYPGPQLDSSRRYYWRVRVWDEDGRVSGWSEIAFWEMGLLHIEDWRARWIEPGLPEDTDTSNPPPMLRRDFQLDGEIQSARAYVTSHGLYELYLNGERVGDQYFSPGWTSYAKRLQYQTYDVTDLLRGKNNTVGVMLGDGWYRGNLTWEDYRNHYGEKLALLLQIKVTYTDGTVELIRSDRHWKAATGPIRMSEIYHGETYDARQEKDGWTEPGYDDSDWAAVEVVDHDKSNLVAQYGPPVKKIEEVRPLAMLETPAGDTVIDMGQNMVGWVRFKVSGERGDTVTLRHAEVLDKDGNFYTDNLRTARQTISYTLKGGREEIYEPRFTFQGFRYVAVDGYPGDLALDNFTGVVLHSAMASGSTFSTSNPLINQLQHNIVWGQKGNFLDVPTDCPQRDERLGWTGDAQVFARTAAFNMNVASFFTKQAPDGGVPHVIPDAISLPGRPAYGSAAWGDAAVIIPWTLYLAYGDQRILEEQYDSMQRWVEFERAKAGDDFLWTGSPHFGDWLAFSTNNPGYPGATTSTEFIATAFLAHSAHLLQRIATILGKQQDAEYYGQLFDRVRTAFQQEFVSANGRVAENTQTAYAVALEFDLLPTEQRPQVAARLAERVREMGHLTTGFVGTPYLTHVLSRYGYLDEAYDLLNREQYPSWLYPVTQGATTIWERWDGQKPDGEFQTPGMNSFNHYAYGAIGDWMYRVVGGLEIDVNQPGYKHFLVQPQPGGGIDSARLLHESLYGPIRIAWERQNHSFTIEVEVPENTSATVLLPDAELGQVEESGQSLRDNTAGVISLKQRQDGVEVEIGSGEYTFSFRVTDG